MADIPAKVKALIESVRSKLTSTPSGRPLDQRRAGYGLYLKEKRTPGLDDGTPVMSYEEWLKQQPAEIGGE